MKTKLAVAIIIFILASSSYAQGALGTGFYDSQIPLLTYTGTWSVIPESISTPDYYLDAVYSTSDVSATVEFSIKGDELRLYIEYQSGGASIDICIDASCSTVDTSYPSSQLTELAFMDLGDDVHNIVISLSSAGSFNFDALFVGDNTPDTLTVAITPPAYISEWGITVGSETYPVAFGYYATAADVVIVSLLAVVVGIGVFVMAWFAFRHWKGYW